MSDYHILNLSENEKSISVVFHFGTPAGNNVAGKSFVNCLKEYKPFTASAVPDVQTAFPTEYTALGNGSKYEHVATLTLDTISVNESQGNKEMWIQTKWAAANAKWQAQIQKVLKWWGFNNNMP